MEQRSNLSLIVCLSVCLLRSDFRDYWQLTVDLGMNLLGMKIQDHKTCYFFNSKLPFKKLPIQKWIGKIAVQLKSHGESEIARN